jgi:ribulose bisphosphate carboxylase small subunit
MEEAATVEVTGARRERTSSWRAASAIAATREAVAMMAG